MSKQLNKTYERHKSVKRGFDWISLDTTNGDTTAQESDENRTNGDKRVDKNAKEDKCYGLSWCPIECPIDNHTIDSEEENNKVETKKTKNSFNWVPLGENFVNVANDDNAFSVPQRLPPKLRRKLTPLKVTPARRPSLGSTSSLRRATFKVTPKTKHHFNMMSLTTTKKRRSSGSNAASFKTPKDKTFSLSANTPSSAAKAMVSVEEIQYMSWINVMLAPKVDDRTDKIDSNQLIIDCFNSTKVCLSVCPTKEELSSEAYREAFKWTQLRASGSALFKSEAVLKINRKIKLDVRNGKFAIRKDRAIHADTGIRKHILDLLMSYNPLWLRIGLETIYNQKIDITSTQMNKSLANFIAQNLLVSKELMAKYGHKTINHFFKDEKHINEAKNYILIKFLFLLNFMDQSKQRRLIEHNPCLFRLSARYKSTLELIISFARDYITGVGDITKHLNKIGFSLSYRQTAIEEFNFEANNLAVDLRCGIRLARLAELTTSSGDLLSKLLFPANNITRKLHNVDIALKAFEDIVPEGITAKDIVSGHRRKTFELLDAIIFKHKTDLILQEKTIYEQHVITIQRRFRANRLMKIESNFYQKLKFFAILLQKRFRENKVIKSDTKDGFSSDCRSVANERQKYLKLRSVAISIQRRFRTNRLMKKERKRFIELKSSVLKVQQRFRANQRMKSERRRYLLLKSSVIALQQRFRANRLTKIERKRWIKLKSLAISIQQRFRANQLMKKERQCFIELKSSAVILQQRFRANQLMRTERRHYLLLKSSVIALQQRFRANLLMKIERKRWLKLKTSVINIQQRFRSNRLMKTERKRFLELKSSAVILQQRFRANQLMKAERKRFIELKSSVIAVQQRFRANQLMKTERKHYLLLKSSALIIQQRFSANQLMKAERKRFIELKSSVLKVQQRFRANQLMRTERRHYLLLKSSVIALQQRFRANLLMKNERKRWLKLKSLALIIQQRFRANQLMKTERRRFLELKSSAIILQQRFRANHVMRIERNNWIQLKSSVIIIQQRFRANQLMKTERRHYLLMKSSAIVIQKRFRANLLMKTERKHFIELKSLAIILQQRFRANQRMRTERRHYLLLKTSVTALQQRFRANLLMKIERKRWLKLKSSAINIQQRFRANQLMKAERKRFVELKSSVLKVQQRFRANQLMRTERRHYLLLKSSVIALQLRFRANLLMKIERKRWLRLKTSVINIQRRFRSNQLMKTERKRFLELKSSAVILQQRFRANQVMRIERNNWIQLKSSVIVIQKRFRANQLMKTERRHYLLLKSSAIVIQKRFRTNQMIKTDRQHWLKLKSSALIIQQRFRANQLMKAERKRFIELKSSVIAVQQRFRANRLMKIERNYYKSLKFYTIFVQKKWKDIAIKVKERRAVIKIQSLWRGYKTRQLIHRDNENVEKAFHKIRSTASLVTKDMLLGNRTYNALQKLLSYNSLLPLAYDLDSLDTTTKLSPDSCETLADHGAVRILVQILSELNRSEPHKEIVILTINILLNLSKFDKTLPKLVSNPKLMEILFKIIQNFSKNNQLIAKCFTLLWILLKDMNIFENVMKDSRKLKAIQNIYEFLKKDKAFKRMKVKRSLNFAPNWKLARSDVHEFENHMIAVQAIAYRLKIN